MRQAGRILDAQQATVVVGVGGYVCTPVYLAAARRRIPVVIHEANAKPGMANRVGARFASVDRLPGHPAAWCAHRGHAHAA